MTLTSDPTETDQAPPAAKGRWIDDWRPEDETFWEQPAARSPAAT